MSSSKSSGTHANKVEVIISQVDANTLQFEMPIDANVSQIKMHIAVHEGIAHSQQTLLLADHILDNRTCLKDLGIVNEVQLQLVVCYVELIPGMCFVCGQNNGFYAVTLACGRCTVLQAYELQHFQHRR
jgi:hypothetical protein